jgi:predicted lipoprotein
MTRILVGALLMVLILVSACQEETATPFERKQMTTDLVDRVILPRHQQFSDKAHTLSDAVNSFASNPDMAQYIIVRQLWTETKQAYKLIQPYNMGDVAQTYVHNKMNKWPVNVAFIEGFISGTDSLDQPFVDGQGSTSKGLSAMEYLLIGDASEETEAYAQLVNAPDSYRRLTLLKAFALDLYYKAYYTNDLWQPNGDNYGQALIDLPTSGIESPVNMLVNEMVERLEQLIVKELGAPLGTDNGGTPEPTDAEAYRSRQSLACVRYGIISVKELFQGDTMEDGSGLSIRAHLAQGGAFATANDIAAHLNAAIAQCDAITLPLEDGVVSDPQQYEVVRQELIIVLSLVKTELVASLAITLTLNDNDGD